MQPKPSRSHNLLIAAARWIRRLQEENARLKFELASLRAGHCICAPPSDGLHLHKCPAYNDQVIIHQNGQQIPVRFRDNREAIEFLANHSQSQHAGACAHCGAATELYAPACEQCSARYVVQVQ